MSSKPQIQIKIISREDQTPIGEINAPRKAIIKSGFGAQPRRAWLELYNEQINAPLGLGDELHILINQTACFRGRIRQVRIDSQGDFLTLFAEWDPSQEFNQTVSQEIQGLTATETIEALLVDSGMTYVPQPAHCVPFARLEFQEHPLLAAIDLMAKLAGNWRWDVDDDAALRLRPFGAVADHIVDLERDQYSIDLWQHDQSNDVRIEIHAGLVNGEELHASVASQELTRSSVERIYARPIVTQDAMNALLAAITMQQNAPHYSHHIDLFGQGEAIQPGDVAQFTFQSALPLFPSGQRFRVKMREITYAHEAMRTRLHLTSAFESSDGYFDEMKIHTQPTAQYLDGRVGAFQLDVSALDSDSHLDAA
ncbi:MAG: hypothetical protein P9L94_19305 [Candidatus Hinthialibacter antarcticus]|nr:hypothetical protein [Candidatus Hinthialibacter antarcticus]